MATSFLQQRFFPTLRLEFKPNGGQTRSVTLASALAIKVA